MSNTFKGIVLALLVAMFLIVAWNPLITPAGRTIGRVASAAWQAAWNDEAAAATVGIPNNGTATNGEYVAPQPRTAEELTALIAARCEALELTPTMEGWVGIDGVEYPCPENGPAAPGPVEDEFLTENVWNGKNAEWALVLKEAGENQWLVAHGDLYADGGSNIAAFKTRAEAQTELRDATWKLILVTVNPDLETLESHLDALNERLGGDYTIVEH